MLAVLHNRKAIIGSDIKNHSYELESKQ